mmetsp:Transcript_30622/g.37821  ORF Transcript_30622/g.37821 Transcript_30622/m.37821 type:complete len:96 (-) Transcript_30622:1350-1637(-)
MQLHEICDHPWFRNNAPIRTVITLESLQAAAAEAEAANAAGEGQVGNITRMSKNITIEGNIDHVEYQVISKPQHAQNLIAAGASTDTSAPNSARN